MAIARAVGAVSCILIVRCGAGLWSSCATNYKRAPMRNPFGVCVCVCVCTTVAAVTSGARQVGQG